MQTNLFDYETNGQKKTALLQEETLTKQDRPEITFDGITHAIVLGIVRDPRTGQLGVFMDGTIDDSVFAELEPALDIAKGKARELALNNGDARISTKLDALVQMMEKIFGPK